MIYEFATASIKLNFPRAVLMTWRERHFITATAPGMDMERGKGYCPLNRCASVPKCSCPVSERGEVKKRKEKKKKVFWIIETHEGQKDLRGYDEGRSHVVGGLSSAGVIR